MECVIGSKVHYERRAVAVEAFEDVLLKTNKGHRADSLDLELKLNRAATSRRQVLHQHKQRVNAESQKNRHISGPPPQEPIQAEATLNPTSHNPWQEGKDWLNLTRCHAPRLTSKAIYNIGALTITVEL